MAKPGDKGPTVKLMQMRLRAAAYPNLDVDGEYGPHTEAAVREYQHNHGLKVDGIAGNATLQALDQQIRSDLAALGRLVIERALQLWLLDIYDPKQSDPSPEAALARNAIHGMIASGLGWTWEPPYAGDGDFEWCGAFAAQCWSEIKGSLRKTYFASTYRLDRFGSYRSVAGEKNPGSGRKLAQLDEHSKPADLPFAPQPGDVITIGPAGSGFGKHICLVVAYNGAGAFETVEGNGNGLGPHGERQQGVVRATRYLGSCTTGWHVRRIIRPSIDDLG